MADRGLLAVNDLALFDAFMLQKGYDSVPTKDVYEERRYKEPSGALVILFRKNTAAVHVTVQSKDLPLVREFINYKYARWAK